MLCKGMTSVTFRNRSIPEIVHISAESGLEGIEWGGDVHVPPGDNTAAETAKNCTLERGLQVLSYGSYYRLGGGADFSPVLQTARTLTAPVIRIWAGQTGSDKAAAEDYAAAAAETRRLCEMAGAYGIQIAYEYHSGTLTDNADSALYLLQACGDCGIRTYWQPRLLGAAENAAEIRKLGVYILYVHVFQWVPDGQEVRRLLLEDGKKDWQLYLQALRDAGSARALLLEFTKEDKPLHFSRDAATLAGLVRRAEIAYDRI